jgi:hypothetical protein
LIVNIQPQNQESFATQVLKQFKFIDHPAVLVHGFANIDDTWQPPPLSPTAMHIPLPAYPSRRHATTTQHLLGAWITTSAASPLAQHPAFSTPPIYFASSSIGRTPPSAKFRTADFHQPNSPYMHHQFQIASTHSSTTSLDSILNQLPRPS